MHSVQSSQSLVYNLASFICALFVLEYGADKFIDHTVILSKRLGVPEGILALLTAGAEWEELAVVIISIARKRSSLALGNVVGSTISNVLGAYSLGLLFVKPGQTGSGTLFDQSSKIYALVQLAFTLLSAALLVLKNSVNCIAAGSVLVAGFAVYVLSIAWYIRRGLLNAPELSDSDSDSDSDDDNDSDSSGDNSDDERAPLNSVRTPAAYGATASAPVYKKKTRGVVYHLVMIILGFSAIILSSFVLSFAATGIADSFGMSDTLVGIVILSIATTLPEKFIAVMSGSRGHMNIMLANTVGSNIFLLGLCLGITLLSTNGQLNQGSVNNVEILVMVASTCFMTATIWAGPRLARFSGFVMLAAYIAFCAVELIKGT